MEYGYSHPQWLQWFSPVLLFVRNQTPATLPAVLIWDIRCFLSKILSDERLRDLSKLTKIRGGLKASAPQWSLCYRPWVVCVPADIVPVTVLISGQLQVFHCRLPVSVPFANFVSQDRHKTQGTPAAVHSNPVTSMHVSVSHLGRQPAAVWARFGVSIQETLAHGAEEARALGCFFFAFAWHTS